jgi:hypothetical protein
MYNNTIKPNETITISLDKLIELIPNDVLIMLKSDGINFDFSILND